MGGLPLDIHISDDADGGRPTVVARPDSELAAQYRRIARREFKSQSRTFPLVEQV